MQNWCTDKQSPRGGCSTKEGKARFRTAIGGFYLQRNSHWLNSLWIPPSNKNMFAFLSAGHDLTSLRCICVNTFVPYICLRCMFLKGHESQIARICGWGRRLTLIKIHWVNVQENLCISLKSNLYQTFFPDVITVHCDKID